MTREEAARPLCTYIFPIRRVNVNSKESQELLDYFRQLVNAGCEVIAVDGSDRTIFAEHHRAWESVCRHIPVDRKYTYLNGKVNGVHTAVDVASCEKIILADDDIRYTPADLQTIFHLLEHHELVRPQNFLRPLPWWARMEAARMLINRAVLRCGDYPGTCAFRRSTMFRVGHYDGDVLFDNEEIVRHFALKGADICYALGLFIVKRPPTLRKWFEQRPRQAYEDFVMRAKTLLFMSILPAGLGLLLTRGITAAILLLAVVSIISIGIAFAGLVRNQAYNFTPFGVLWFAPAWVLERSVSVYCALYWRLFHGGYPFGAKVLSKGTGRAWVEGGKLARRAVSRREN